MSTIYPNWFKANSADIAFARHLGPGSKGHGKALQIGVFTGDASCWFLKNMPEWHLTDVDTWGGSNEVEHSEFDWFDVEATYINKVAPYTDQLTTIKTTSDEFFVYNESTFDFIYIDGDHTEKAVIADAENSWKVLNPGGIMAFDDYTWGQNMPMELRPHRAIRNFVQDHVLDITVLEIGRQFWLKKN